MGKQEFIGVEKYEPNGKKRLKIHRITIEAKSLRKMDRQRLKRSAKQVVLACALRTLRVFRPKYANADAVSLHYLFRRSCV